MFSSSESRDTLSLILGIVDNLGNTAGDVCLSLNSEGGYRLIRDAGLRSGIYFHH